jgi:hypothetical protein
MDNKEGISQIGSTDAATSAGLHLPKQAPVKQGLKRKEGADDRMVDSGAQPAIFVSDLPWWITDDDIRGWANQSECEDELEELTFSEHKVNGKSKGYSHLTFFSPASSTDVIPRQVYILFSSPQAATAAKHKIESFGEGQKYRQRFTVSFTSPTYNPFKTTPKDGPTRNGGQGNRAASGGYNNNATMNGAPSFIGNTAGGAYRGRGGYNRGGMSTGGYSRGGFQQPMAQSYNAGGMNGGYQAPAMGAMGYGGGFQNRGGMMPNMRGGGMGGMRGGARGGMSTGMMGMPMGGMGMGMPQQMGMGGMPQMGMQGRSTV